MRREDDYNAIMHKNAQNNKWLCRKDQATNLSIISKSASRPSWNDSLEETGLSGSRISLGLGTVPIVDGILSVEARPRITLNKQQEQINPT